MISPRHALPLLLLLAGTVIDLQRLTAQCATNWLPGFSGLNGEAHTTLTWDPDGPGPVPARIVVGGLFTAVGTMSANNIAVWDPNTGGWSPLGSGMNGGVEALAVLQNGDLVAGGSFSVAGGAAASNIARWSGSSWQPLGAGVSSDVYAMKVRANGSLIVGGYFTSAGGSSANRIAEWNPVTNTWSTFGSGIGSNTGDDVRALAILPSGEVVAGGTFTVAGGVSALRVARWNGLAWAAFGSSGQGMNAQVYALAVLATGDLVAGGYFTSSTPGGAFPYIARWNGSAWAPFGVTPNSFVRALAVDSIGSLWVGGGFTSMGSFNARRVAVLSGGLGGTWSNFGTGQYPSDFVRTIAVYESGGYELAIFGGDFLEVQYPRYSCRGVAAVSTYDMTFFPMIGTSSWSGSAGPMAVLPSGDVVVGHVDRAFPGISALSTGAGGIARWNGTAWSSMGAGVLPSALLCMGSDVIAAEQNTIKRWDGVSWSSIGAFDNDVFALAAFNDGTLVAGGSFTSTLGAVACSRVAKRDPLSGVWSPLGLGTNDTVFCLSVLSGGRLAVGGAFTSAGGAVVNRVAIWDKPSGAWSTLGSGANSGVNAIAEMSTGHLAVGGSFSTVGGISANAIAEWTGVAWQPMGLGMGDPVLPVVGRLLALPNGGVLAGGIFQTAGGNIVNNIARWDGNAWSNIGSGVQSLPIGSGYPSGVAGLAFLPSGTLLVGGAFWSANGTPANQLAYITSTCPANAVSYGAGCVGSGGQNLLTLVSLPWIGSTFRARAAGMPAQALVLSIYGLSQLSVPVAAVLPQGLPGCMIYMTSDVSELFLPVAGQVETQLAIPNAQSLVGVTLNHYVVPLEVNASIAITAITTTNALAITVGSF